MPSKARRAAGLKAAQTRSERYTAEELSEWGRRGAARGGSAKVAKGFAKNKSLARRAGEKGGKASRATRPAEGPGL